MNLKKNNMLQSYDPYYRVVPNILSGSTKKELLEIVQSTEKIKSFKGKLLE